MKVGDLVITNSGTKHHGAIGVVIATQPRWIEKTWLDERTELLVTVSYPETGSELKWSEHNLVVVG